MAAADYLEDYVPVDERIRLLKSTWPQSVIRCSEPIVVTVREQTFIQVGAEVWRTPDDPLPVRAFAWEPFPGRTPYTRDSEQMNCETSAVGRAIAMLGIGVRRSIASMEEVRNRTQPQDLPSGPPVEAGAAIQPRHVSQARERRIARLKRDLASFADTVAGQRELLESIVEHAIPGEAKDSLTAQDLNNAEAAMSALKDGRAVIQFQDGEPRIVDKPLEES
jgi:hypothetical protein